MYIHNYNITIVIPKYLMGNSGNKCLDARDDNKQNIKDEPLQLVQFENISLDDKSSNKSSNIVEYMADKMDVNTRSIVPTHIPIVELDESDKPELKQDMLPSIDIIITRKTKSSQLNNIVIDSVPEPKVDCYPQHLHEKHGRFDVYKPINEQTDVYSYWF